MQPVTTDEATNEGLIRAKIVKTAEICLLLSHILTITLYKYRAAVESEGNEMKS